MTSARDSPRSVSFGRYAASHSANGGSIFAADLGPGRVRVTEGRFELVTCPKHPLAELPCRRCVAALKREVRAERLAAKETDFAALMTANRGVV